MFPTEAAETAAPQELRVQVVFIVKVAFEGVERTGLSLDVGADKVAEVTLRECLRERDQDRALLVCGELGHGPLLTTVGRLRFEAFGD